MTPFDELLSGYMDGALDETQVAEIERLLSERTELRQRLDALIAANEIAVRALILTSESPMPARLVAMLEENNAAEDEKRISNKNVLPFPRLPGRLSRLAMVAASCAAALAVGFVVDISSTSHSTRALEVQGLIAGTIIEGDHPLYVAFEQGRSGVTATIEAEQETEARPMLSFRSTAGHFCRQMNLRVSGNGFSTLACKQDGAWRLIAVAAAEVSEASAYQQASGAAPADIEAAIDRLIAGAPLDVEGETRAIRDAWVSNEN